ncbi:hypothetical protein HF394_16420 [Planococcus glaciei]|uniref:Uncharacterized protein n=1 Tax=Planococcus glaciei TaxID=459472 RepID=A0A7H8QES9_9BACL|nr:hypothetical protein [Planococcus glaciei]ETP68062.1 hypothetical protein G159_14050 [Planococcus glaciei CHR43]QDY46450.1 hypothetical protein FK545_17125 [Planococcus glaciei]QKX52032.1 hypothetical protein HF394_16420 [Planococcus glaciei]
MAVENKPEEQYASRKEREEIGRRTNAGFARVERTEVEEGASEIPTGPIGQKLSEEEIRRRVGEGNFETAKDDRQTNSINS